ncbi:glycosylhydrolase family 76-2 protein [Paramyrothecium foliicola]|nr:glycosylhydrolase family 76-2 protein [Paramyrothecium foliicola]
MAASALYLGLLISGVHGAYYSLDTREDILEASRTLAYDLMLLYPGNQTGQVPGVLPGPPPAGPYYWWQGGAMMGTYIEYWHYTGDTSYNEVVTEGILHQVGHNRDFQPLNHTRSLGNDDQGFWGLTAMLAAELKFPDPPRDQPQWLALAQAVWVTQADPSRYDDVCGGGLRWQIPPMNGGYDYKNNVQLTNGPLSLAISNGIFFNLGARLARYTGNDTYARYAEDAWDWIWAVNFIDHDNWLVYDGGHDYANCTDIDKASTYSYNAGIMLQGAAFMYDYTNGSKKWEERLENLVDSTIKRFFPDGVAVEVYCEPWRMCDQDMLSFKGYVHRWLTTAYLVAPFIADKIKPVLRTSAEAAVAQCTGGDNGRACGFYWDEGKYYDPALDETTGAGERMNVFAAVFSLLAEEETDKPVTNSTGGTSAGDPTAGLGSDNGIRTLKPIKTADRVGAAILTAVIVISAVGTFAWLCWPEKQDQEDRGKAAEAPVDAAAPAAGTAPVAEKLPIGAGGTTEKP